ncbi:hypothetical protein Tco_0637876, partial [Tanacetum coccineum]
MFKDKSYLAYEDHKNLFEALEKSLERDHSNQLLSDLEEARRKKRKKHASPRTPFGSPPSQPPPPPPPAGASGALASAQQQGSKASSSSKTAALTPQSMAWTTSDNRYESTGVSAAHESSPTDYLMKEDSIPEEQFQMEECHKMLTNQVDWTNPEGDQVRIDVNRPLPLGGPLGHGTIQTQFFFNKDLEYLRYGNKKSGLALYFQDEVMLSYGYYYLSKIVLRRANFQEYKIAEKDFKNLYPSNFEDLDLLFLQGYLDHLSGSDKRMLSTVVKLWTRNLVIQQRVEDFQLGIESYQKQLNLTKPGWDAKGYEFKHDYTIIESTRAVVFPVNHNEQKIMRFNKIYKFSDGTLKRILEALDYRVKEFMIKRLNPDVPIKRIDKSVFTDSKITLISSEKIEEVMADIQTKTTMEEFATNDKANYYSGIASILVNGKRAYDLKGKFLYDLRNNALSWTNGEDAVEHIEYFLKINYGQEGVADKEFSEAEKANNDDEQETAKIYRIETNLFDYETPLCTYEDYKHKLNDELEEPWFEDGVPYEICDHICEPSISKMGKLNVPLAIQMKTDSVMEESYRECEDEEYVAIKEHEYDDLTSTNEDACCTYQEIFRRMDEGWM